MIGVGCKYSSCKRLKNAKCLAHERINYVLIDCVDACSNTVLSSLNLMYLVLKWCLLLLLFSSTELKYLSIILLTIQNFLYKCFTNDNEGIALTVITSLYPPPPSQPPQSNGLEHIFSNLLSCLLKYA